MDDSSIDYFRLVNSDVYKKDYIQMSNQLKKVDLDLLLDKDDKTNDNNLLAFFISILFEKENYNLFYL